MEIVCRSQTEQIFLKWISPCPRCGDPLDGRAEHYALKWSHDDLEEGNKRVTVAGFCPNCAEPIKRVYVYPKDFDPPELELGGPEPSTAISPERFRAIAERALSAPEDAVALGVDDFLFWRHQVRLGLYSVNELAKFGDDVTEEKRRLETLQGIYDPLLEDAQRRFNERYRTKRKFDKPAYEAHKEWLESGGRSGTRLDLEGEVIAAVKTGSMANLSRARLRGCWVICQVFDFGNFEETEFIDCRGFYSRFGLGELNRARFIDCRFTGADFSVSHLREVRICGGEFRRTGFVRGELVEAQISGVDMRGARFGDNILDDAVFEDCDLREAKFGTAKELFAHRGVTHNTIFRRCDLRGAEFAGRNLNGAVFVDCKMYGITGPARNVAGIKVSGADLSEAGDRSVSVSKSEVERILAWG